MAQGSPQPGSKVDTGEILKRLEALVSSAGRLPLTKRVLLDPGELQGLLAQLRASMPQEAREAQELLRYRDRIIGQAQEEAQRLRSSAEREVLQKVSDSQILKEARDKFDQRMELAQRDREALLAEAGQQAAARMSEADGYALEVLSRLEGDLNNLLTTARRGLELLRERQARGQPAQR